MPWCSTMNSPGRDGWNCWARAVTVAGWHSGARARRPLARAGAGKWTAPGAGTHLRRRSIGTTSATHRLIEQPAEARRISAQSLPAAGLAVLASERRNQALRALAIDLVDVVEQTALKSSLLHDEHGRDRQHCRQRSNHEYPMPELDPQHESNVSASNGTATP